MRKKIGVRVFACKIVRSSIFAVCVADIALENHCTIGMMGSTRKLQSTYLVHHDQSTTQLRHSL